MGSGRLIELKEKVSKEQQAIDPQESIIHELIIDIPPPPHRSSRIFHPPKRFMGILTKDVEEIFLIGDKGYGDDLNTFDEIMSDIDFKK